ncbi:MAG: spore coat protein [Clostridiales bacterium]|nr:spore coat protein [Clostridiales bacterium]
MNDQERLTDLLLTEKKMSGNYNTYASECTNAKLRNSFLQMLQSGHTTQTELYDASASRGWYKTTQADSARVGEVKQKFQAMG